ncbi:MAG: hypothetical protein WCT42_03825 [Candidatus Paceibacterota bacterium]|jgi:hypothetical protein
MENNFNKINKEVQPELDLNFEDIQKSPEENNSDDIDEIEIPSADELEKLKETDFEEYLLWLDRITNIELKKHEEESEEIARLEEIRLKEVARQEEIRLKEIDDNLYKDETEEEKRQSQLYGQG